MDEEESSGLIDGLANALSKVTSDPQQERRLQEVVELIRKSLDDDTMGDPKNFNSLSTVFLPKYRRLIADVMREHLEIVDFQEIRPSAFYYYLEKEDSAKTPSWKRRIHRFYPSFPTKNVPQLHSSLMLARLSYTENVETIKRGLETHEEPYELAFAQVVSEPGKPAHYLAVKRKQPTSSSDLEVLLVIRGTKTIADAVTDLCCGYEEYRGGLAHCFMLKSARNLLGTTVPYLEDLAERSNKQNIQVHLLGHSLGAGVAAIMTLELNDKPNFYARATTFGCPAVLSNDLAQKTQSSITSVIADGDIVPRASGATVANLLLKLERFDHSAFAQRDFEAFLQILQERQPCIFNPKAVAVLKESIVPLLADALAKTETSKKCAAEPVLFPAGKCVHFYRDGLGISGKYVPNDLFIGRLTCVAP